MVIETGKIISIIGFMVLGVLFGSTVGYNIGHAYGTLEVKTKIAEQQLVEQADQTQQTSSAYSAIPEDPLAKVILNPFE